jgi:hypothetical protein
MPLTSYALDTFVSQEVSKLTACTARPFGDEFPNREAWISQFILRRIFHDHVSEQRAPLAFALLRRAEAALDEWELACAIASGDLRRPSAYFKALRHFEACIASLWQGFELGRNAIGTKIFQKGDGSANERLNSIYNEGRHFDPTGLPAGDLHPVWITNDGIRTQEVALTFEELRESLASLARIASGIVDGPAPSAPAPNP